jgi:hypothetical protein
LRFDGNTTTIRITEGALKADAATRLSGILTIGLPGVNAWKRAARLARLLNAQTVLVAFDADATANRHVANALDRLVRHLQAEGFTVVLERWPLSAGKGIDDVLVNGGLPERVEGESVLPAVAQIVAAVCAAEPAPGRPSAGEPSGDHPAEALNDPHRLARSYLGKQAHPDRLRLAFFREQFWFWTGTHWLARPDTEVRAELARHCKRQLDADFAMLAAVPFEEGKGPPKVSKVTTGLVTNVMQALSGEVLLRQETLQPSWLGDTPVQRHYVALRNGLLDVDALMRHDPDPLRPHSPWWFSPVCLPYDFDPDADCPRWIAFLDRNLEGKHSSKALLLQQFAGYLLLPVTKLQRFLLMTGEGANGKSVVCAVLRVLLGEDNVSSVPLEMFGDKFRLAGTLGKFANIVPEVGELDKVAEGQLKAFVTGDPLRLHGRRARSGRRYRS